MAFNVTNDQEAQALARRYMNGELVTEGEQAAAVAALRKYKASKQAVAAAQRKQDGEQAATPPDEESAAPMEPNQGEQMVEQMDAPVQPPEEERGFLGNAWEATKGAADVGATLVTGAVGEVVGGWAGLINLAITRDVDSAANDVRAVSAALTNEVDTEYGRKAMETVGKPLIWLEQAADDVSFKLASENPLAATVIKTSLMGLPELLGAKTAGAKGAVLRQKQKQVREVAKRHGVNLRESTMRGDVLEAASRMSPADRAQNVPAIREALIQAKEAQRITKQAKYDNALAKRAFVNVEDTAKMAKASLQSLIDDGFDVTEMPVLQKRLDELQNLGTQKPGVGTRKTPVVTAQLRDLETIRKRINKNMPADAAEAAALRSLKGDIDNLMDGNFNQTAISGDPSAIQAWKEAREAHHAWKQRFDENKHISKLITDQKATPGELWRWMVGANAMNGAPQALRTVRELKRVLGPDHPAMVGMRTDFLYEALSPLLAERPNFQQFLRNYDNMVRKNKPLMDEMRINQGDFKELVDLARAADRLPDPHTGGHLAVRMGRQLVQAINNTGSKLAFGHGMTKATMKVNLSRNILNMMMGTNRISQKQILNELLDINLDAPAIRPDSRDAAHFIISAAPVTIPAAEEDRNRRNGIQ